MNKTTIAAILTAIVLVAGVGGFIATRPTKSSTEPTKQANTTNQQAKPEATKTSGKFIDYSPEAVKTAAENGDKTVLFFHAKWCPTCRSLEKSLNADAVPDKLTVLKVDYDTATELKKQYGITFQHTLVQIDKDGKALNKWAHSSNAAEIVDELI